MNAAELRQQCLALPPRDVRVGDRVAEGTARAMRVAESLRGEGYAVIALCVTTLQPRPEIQLFHNAATQRLLEAGIAFESVRGHRDGTDYRHYEFEREACRVRFVVRGVPS